MEWLEDVGRAVYIGAGLFWKALWALVLGYTFSSLIQVFVSRAEAAKHLGKGGVKETGLAMLFGPISSACSFAALSASRALLTKGAHLIPALAFLFASTNLSFEVGALAWIFLGWQFALALYVGAFAHVAAMAAIVRVTYPTDMVERARERAQKAGGEMAMDPSEGLSGSWGERVRNREAWRRVGAKFIDEWRMVWKDLLGGFLVAGAVTALVPDAVFEAIFPKDLPIWLLVPIHALLGPVLGIATIIGSLGNGPLAAVLWQNGVLFAGIVAFLYSDFVVLPSLHINATYYGWRFAAYLGVVFVASAVVAGIVMHALFAVLGLIPEPQSGRVEEMAQFAIDYTLFLNLATLAIAGVLVWLSRGRGRMAGQPAAPASRQQLGARQR